MMIMGVNTAVTILMIVMEEKMNKTITIISLGMIVVLGGVLFDIIFVRAYTLFGYIFICSWELMIFALGIFVGKIIWD